MKNNLVSSFTKTFHKYISKGDAVLVGVSGGPDSTALFHLLNLIKYQYKLTIYAAHFNHMLRGKDSSIDAEFVRKMAALYGVPFIYGEKDIKKLAAERKGGIEKVARDERYKFFIENALRLKAGKIALAHNKDDNAETVLFRMISGSGGAGLSGIPSSRIVNSGEFGIKERFHNKIMIVRPLIDVLKKDILEYLKAEEVPFVIDKTNSRDIYMRNRLRNRLIPQIEKEYNNSFKDALSSTAGILAEENEFMGSAAQSVFPRVTDVAGNTVKFNVKKLKSMHRALRLRVIKSALEMIFIHVRMAASRAVTDVENCLLNGGKASLPEGFVCEQDGAFVVVKKPIRQKKNAPVRVYKPGVAVEFNGARYCLEVIDNSADIDLKDQSCAYFDAEKILFPVIFRDKKNGDRFIPFGMKHEVKLKKFASGKGMKKPLTIIADKNNIIWVSGRVDDRVLVGAGTKKILKVSIN